ncbi:MAG: hypothetical protein NTV23_15965 [Propionibacteriales bacterium]|nr:hypothetical protein [Propionibacteriales bacterium]
MKPPRLLLLAVSGVSLFAFSGCAPVGDVAIKVDDRTYTHHDIDALVDFQCAATAAQPQDPQNAAPTVVSRAQARSEMAGRLFDSAVFAEVAAKAGVEPDLAAVKTQLAGLQDVVDRTVPAADRARVVALITETYVSASVFETAFVKAYGEEALGQLDQAGILAAAQKLKDEVVQSADVELDPVYGLSEDGQAPNANKASLSQAVSTFAKDAATTPAPAEWITGLPASQTCG